MSSDRRGRRGEGSVGRHRRPDGRYEGRVELGVDEDGKRVRRVFYGRTRKDVQDQVRAALLKQQFGALGVSPNQSTKQFLEAWLSDVVKPRKRFATWHRYDELMRLHVIPIVGNVPLEKLSPQHVQSLLNAKVANGKLSGRTVFHIRSVLRTALGQAVRWGLVMRNAAALTDAPRVEDKERAYLTQDAAARLLEAAGIDRLEALYVLTLALGLRQGEALGLRWDDVDLDAKRLRVRHALQRVERVLRLVETKTPKSRRTLTLPTAVVDALRAHRERQLFERRAAAERWNDTGFVFTTTIGTPLDAANVRHGFAALVKRADLPPMRFYDLRHSCATFLLTMGIPARVVMEILGHSQIAFTMNTYSHVLPVMHEQAADAMDQVLTPQARREAVTEGQA